MRSVLLRHGPLRTSLPITTPVAPATPAVPLTRANDTRGIDWLSVAFGASAILALLLIVAVIRFGWPRVRPIRARRA